MRQHLIEIHCAHHRADIGHRQRGDGVCEIGDFVARLRGVEYLIERHAIHRHRGVIAGDDLLTGNVDHLLHHVHLAPDAVEIRNDEIQARRERAGEFAEPFDGPVIALRHGLHAREQRDDNEQHDGNGENIESGHQPLQAQ